MIALAVALLCAGTTAMAEPLLLECVGSSTASKHHGMTS
jgi:hypothetical protein